MRLVLFLFLFLHGCVTVGQNIHKREFDQFANVIEKNVFRLMFTVLEPFDEGLPLTFSYEREIIKPFTLVLQGGPYISRTASVDEGHVSAINGFISSELRFYFNLFRRIRKEKVVRNFSASYISIEHNLLSNPIMVINQSRIDAVKGSSTTYLNLGRQRQFKQGYLNVFIGPSINMKELTKGWMVLDDFHVGISLGIILFE